MIKILAAVVSSLLLSASYAEDNNSCSPIRSAYSAAYSKLNTTCANLGHCQKLRTACPQQVDEMASCTVFNECMAEQFSENATRTSKCVYEWYSQPNEAGKCSNKNRSIDIVSNRCPGLTLFGDVFQDKNFNCDGHKGRYWNEHAAFFSAKRDYEQAMENGTCHKLKLPEPTTCAAAFESVSSTDQAHGASDRISDGQRDPTSRLENVLEFQSQFTGDGLEQQAGSTSSHR